MKRFLSTTAFLSVVAFAVVLTGCDKKNQAPQLKISQLRANPAPAGASTGAVYLEIQNQGSDDDVLMAAKSDSADSAEIHETKIDETGMMQMNHLPSLVIPAGKTVTFGPGGLHLMLIGLKGALQQGESVILELDFKKAGVRKMSVPIEGLVVGSGPMPNDEMHKKAMGNMPNDEMHKKAMGKMPNDEMHKKAMGNMPMDEVHKNAVRTPNTGMSK